MAPQTPRRGEVITRQGKKYRFEGVDAATGQWKLRPLGAAEGQSDAEGFARTAAQGATFGFSDEIAGGFGWLGGKGYKASRDRERENLAQYRGEHGKTAMLAEGLGGLATGLLAPGLLAAKAGGAGVRGAIGLARGGSAAARTARAAEVGGGLGKGGTALSKMGQAAKLGAAEGSIYGVGSGGEQRGATLGESLKSRALSGAGGAAMGLLSGGLMRDRGGWTSIKA